jgi:hypothetical protein
MSKVLCTRPRGRGEGGVAFWRAEKVRREDGQLEMIDEVAEQLQLAVSRATLPRKRR